MNNDEYTKKEHLEYLKEKTENLMEFYPEFKKERKEVILELFKKVEKTPGSFLLHPNFVWRGDRDPAHASFGLTFGCGIYEKKEIKFTLPKETNRESVILQWNPERKKLSLQESIDKNKLHLTLQKPTLKYNPEIQEELLVNVKFENNLTFKFKNNKFNEKKIPEKLEHIYQNLILTLHIPIKNNLRKEVKDSLSNFDIRESDVDLTPYIGGVIYATITSNKLKGDRPLGYVAFSNLWLNSLIHVKKHWVNEKGRVKELSLESILSLIYPFSSFGLFFNQKTDFESHKPMIFINGVNRLIVKLNKQNQ